MCINCSLNEALGAFATAAEAAPRAPLRLSRRGFVGGTLACTAAASAAPLSALAATGDADIILRGGKIYTQNPAQPWAEALAVRGKTIAAVGTTGEIDKLKGAGTKVVELNGRLVMPGFVEGHIHPFLGAFLTSGIDLQVPTKDEALAAIARYARENPTGNIRGFGWRVDMFPPEGPTRQELDKIIPDRPAFFFAIDGHSLWVNSKALEVARVTKDTPDPIPRFSYYVRDKDGHPTGYALEVNAVLALVNAIEPISPVAFGKLAEGWLPKASAAGITAIFDAGVPPVGSDQSAILKLYTDLEARGALPFRVVGSYLVKSPPVEGTVAALEEMRAKVASELVQIAVVKIIGDGTQEGYTAWLLEPYADRPDFTGGSPFSRDEWTRLIGAVDKAGFDVHVHACGEGTTRAALDAIEQAIAANPQRQRRHTIAHLVYVDDADIPRFGKLGVIGQFSANWMSADPDTTEILKDRYGARQQRIYRPRSQLEAGGRISFGTDWPAAGYFSTFKPLDSIQIAVTRQLIGAASNPVLEPAAERLTLAQAVHANTLGAAYQIRMDDKIGSLEVGKMADLVVLEKNIFDGPVHAIAATRIDLTLMNGKLTHGEV
ncbi:amidohydrolase [Xanthobacter sp. DSM 24535]|uniref:amidohydrolase n=1 Tax=Roseixanthobacter psychrophilus TaxID=3119917 RepID=UPI00372B19AF